MVIGHLINPTDYVLDIGANIGLHTVWFGPNTHFQGHVSPSEPNEFNRQLLVQNLRQNHCMNAEVYTNVVGDRTGLVL